MIKSKEEEDVSSVKRFRNEQKLSSRKLSTIINSCKECPHKAFIRYIGIDCGLTFRPIADHRSIEALPDFIPSFCPLKGKDE